MSSSGSTITNTTTLTPVTLLTVNSANDPAGEVTANEVFFVPNAPLAKATTYHVQVTGTVAGAAFSRDFTFSTAK